MSQPELQPAAAHLENCAVCRTEFDLRQDLDREIGRQLRDVPLPMGLRERIQARLALEAAEMETVPTPHLPLPAAPQPIQATPTERKPEGYFSRRMALSVFMTVAASIFGVAILWWSQPPRPVDVPLETMLVEVTAAKLPPGSLATPASDIAVQPSSMQSLRPMMSGEPLAFLRQGRVIGSYVSFELTARNGAKFQGALFAIDPLRVRLTTQDQSLIGTSFSDAPIEYVNGIAVKVWREYGLVFICFVRAPGPAALESLTPQVIST